MFSNESESPNNQAGLAQQEGPVTGNGHTSEAETALIEKCQQLEADLVRAIEINEELYNKALELQDRNVELESKISELEQEAETLAMQLQNSWHLGYQKGQADTLAKIEKEAASPVATAASPALEEKLSEAHLPESPSEEAPFEEITREAEEIPASRDLELEKELEEETESQAPAVKMQAETQEIHLRPGQPVYGEENFNIIVENRAPINSGDIVSKLSWKEIETVYQYSTVAGRPGTNLYFEPYSTHQERLPETPASSQFAEATTPDLTVLPEPTLALEEPPVTTPPPAVDTSATGSQFSNIWGDDATYYNPETSTFDGLESVPTLQACQLEAPDELDLEKLDIFEGLEDLEDLKSIEVIEDVVLPDLEAKAATEEPLAAATQAPVSAAPEPTAAAKAVNEQDLRDLIKLRIKNIQEDQIDSKAAMAAVSGPGTPPPSPAPPKEPSPLDIPRPGVRNKFIGGKATTETPPPSPTPVAAAPKALPPEIRKACMLLGLRQEELTEQAIREAWKKQITQVHPDLEGGDHESAIYLNSAKEQLLKWLSDSTPKLGKKFGAKQEPNPTKTPFSMKGPGSDPHKK